MVGLRAELEDRAAEQAELHADLDQHRQVAEGEGLEGGDRGADVAAAAVLLGKPMPVWPVSAIITTTSLTRSRKSAVAHLLLVEEDLRVLGEVGADQVADLAVATVEEHAERVDVDLGLAVARVVGVDAGVVHPLDRGGLGQRRGHLVGHLVGDRAGPARWPWRPK